MILHSQLSSYVPWRSSGLTVYFIKRTAVLTIRVSIWPPKFVFPRNAHQQVCMPTLCLTVMSKNIFGDHCSDLQLI